VMRLSLVKPVPFVISWVLVLLMVAFNVVILNSLDIKKPPQWVAWLCWWLLLGECWKYSLETFRALWLIPSLIHA
jgi:hypothetical protein